MAPNDESRSFPIAPLEEHEVPGFFETDAQAFGARMPKGVKELIERVMNAERIVASRDSGEVVGTAASEASTMTLPGLTRLPAAMVVAVSVVPSHRRQGRLTSLMRYQLSDLRDRGEPLASLYASEGGIYGRFGYGQATFGSTYTLDKRTARLARPASEFGHGRVRLLGREQALEAFPAVFADYAPTRAGELARDGEIDFLTAVGDPGGDELVRRFNAVYEADGRIDGYVGYEIAARDETGTKPRRVIAHEICALTTAACVGLWDFLLGIDLTVELEARNRPVDEPIRWLLNDPRQLQTTRSGDRTWIRLVDVGAALAGRHYGSVGSLVLAVDDRVCDWNAGCYRVSVDEEWGPAEIARTDDAPDLELEASTLASIYLGGVSPVALATVGRVGEVSPGSVHKMARMFANDQPPFCLTNF